MNAPSDEDIQGLCLAMNEVRDYNDKDGIGNMWAALLRFVRKYPQFAHGDIATATLPDPLAGHPELFQ
jgi:hypothetical protein